MATTAMHTCFMSHLLEPLVRTLNARVGAKLLRCDEECSEEPTSVYPRRALGPPAHSMSSLQK